jgi:hypothetical protein
MSLDPDSTSIAEFNGHIKGRPISWVVVVLVCGGFIAAGVGLIAALPWLFFVGIGVVVVGWLLGWFTHAMADATARVETPARQRDAVEPAAKQPELGQPAERMEEPAAN